MVLPLFIPYSLPKVPNKTPIIPMCSFKIFAVASPACLLKYHMFKNSCLLTYISAQTMWKARLMFYIAVHKAP